MDSTVPLKAHENNREGGEREKEKKSVREIVREGARRMGRGAAVGYGVLIALSLLRSLRRGRLPSFLSLSSGELRFVLLCGLSPALLKGVYQILNVRGIFSSTAIPSLIAGAVAGLPLFLVTDHTNSQSSVSLYVLVRALELVVREFWKSHSLPSPPHLDSAIFILSCTEIMHAWFYHPWTIPSVYAQWITRLAKYGVRSDFLRQYCLDWHLNPVDADFLQSPISCTVVHPEDPNSCVGNILRRWWNGFPPSLAIYTPVHLLPVLLLNFQSLLRSPAATLARVCVKIVQSASFLSSFIGLVWVMVCFLRTSPFRGEREYVGPLLGCFACGFSVFIERKSRRIELALKVLPDAMISIWRRCVTAGLIKDLPFADVYIFSFALSVLSYYYFEKPHSMKPSIRGLFHWCFG